MAILHQKNLDKINILKERQIPKAATSLNLFNDTINGRNDPLYRILLLVDRFQHINQPEEWWKYF